MLFPEVEASRAPVTFWLIDLESALGSDSEKKTACAALAFLRAGMQLDLSSEKQLTSVQLAELWRNLPFMVVTSWVLYGSVAVVFVLLSAVILRRGQVSSRVAVNYVKQGALVVDVRSPREFDAGHLSQAFNFPLDELEGSVAQKVKDKNRVILVHCRTGLRSKKAKERLARIGYTNVFVLGSYARAFRIVSGRAR